MLVTVCADCALSTANLIAEPAALRLVIRDVYLLSVLTLETAGTRSSFHYLYYKYLHNVQ